MKRLGLLLSLLIGLQLALGHSALYAEPQPDASAGILDRSYQEVQALALVKTPEEWIDKKVSFTGVFNSFHSYALNYNKAKRDSKEYISFLIRRPDVNHHKIPLSELKLIYPRAKVERVVDLESGDKVLIKGKVFSAALGDPWIDVDEVIILTKGPESKKKTRNKKSKKD